MKFAIHCGALLLGAAVSSAAVAADVKLDWPGKQITWVVGFVPGGTADVLTRIAAQELARQSGLNVVVENRPGAAGAIALQLVARSKAADGYLLTVPGPLIYPTPQPEIGRELAPVILMAQGPMVIVGPARTRGHRCRTCWKTPGAGPRPGATAVPATAPRRTWPANCSTSTPAPASCTCPTRAAARRWPTWPAARDSAGHPRVGPGHAADQGGTLKAYAVTTPYRLDSLPGVPTVEESDSSAARPAVVLRGRRQGHPRGAAGTGQRGAAGRHSRAGIQGRRRQRRHDRGRRLAGGPAGLHPGGRRQWKKLLDSGAVKLEN